MRKSKHKIKIITNTIHSNSGSGRLLCPMCAWQAAENLMIYGAASNLYTCSVCGYQTPPNLDPIHEEKIQAGNENSDQKPYVKSVGFSQKKTEKSDNLHGSFEEAWKS